MGAEPPARALQLRLSTQHDGGATGEGEAGQALRDAFDPPPSKAVATPATPTVTPLQSDEAEAVPSAAKGGIGAKERCAAEQVAPPDERPSAPPATRPPTFPHPRFDLPSWSSFPRMRSSYGGLEKDAERQERMERDYARSAGHEGVHHIAFPFGVGGSRFSHVYYADGERDGG